MENNTILTDASCIYLCQEEQMTYFSWSDSCMTWCCGQWNVSADDPSTSSTLPSLMLLFCQKKWHTHTHTHKRIEKFYYSLWCCFCAGRRRSRRIRGTTLRWSWPGTSVTWRRREWCRWIAAGCWRSSWVSRETAISVVRCPTSEQQPYMAQQPH